MLACSPACSPSRRRPSRSSSPTIPLAREPETAGRVGRPAVGHRPVLRPGLQPVRHAGARASQRPRAEHQHHRRGARLELVHQPHRQRARSRSRSSCAGPIVGTGAGVADSGRITREKSAGAAPGFTAQDANGETWFVSFDAPANPEGGDRRRRGRDEDFWALGYNQVEYFLTALRPDAIEIDPNGDDAPPVRRAHAADATTMSARSSSGPTAAPTARIAPPPGACCRARCSAASSTTAPGPTIRTTSSRTSTGASCGRCACSAPGPTSPT